MATISANSHTFGIELAKALGLNINELKEYTLRVPCDDIITIEATYIVIEPNNVVEVVKKFEVSMKEV